MQDTHCEEEIKFGRRQLLVGASLAGAIATLPQAAHAAQKANNSGSIKQMYLRWLDVKAQYNSNTAPDDEDQHLADEMSQLEQAILAVSPANVTEYACKALIINEFAEIESVPYGEVFIAEARELID